MTDVVTTKPLVVSSDAAVGLFITVPVSQLDEVCRLLDGRGIRYWVDEYAVSLDGEPEVTDINLGRGGDAVAVQALLDSAA